jgi:hypothetical protein
MRRELARRDSRTGSPHIQRPPEPYVDNLSMQPKLSLNATIFAFAQGDADASGADVSSEKRRCGDAWLLRNVSARRCSAKASSQDRQMQNSA